MGVFRILFTAGLISMLALSHQGTGPGTIFNSLKQKMGMSAFSAKAQTQGCAPREQGALQDRRCTPGYVREESQRHRVCANSGDLGPIPAGQRRKVFRAYGMEEQPKRKYTVVRLVPASLGGTNRMSNLFPQRRSYSKRKLKVERRLRKEVCAGLTNLPEAQKELALDWRAAGRPPSVKARSGFQFPEWESEFDLSNVSLPDLGGLSFSSPNMQLE